MPKRILNKRNITEVLVKQQLTVTGKQLIEELKPIGYLIPNAWKIKDMGGSIFSVSLVCQSCGRHDVFDKVDTELARAFYKKYLRKPYKCLPCE